MAIIMVYLRHSGIKFPQPHYLQCQDVFCVSCGRHHFRAARTLQLKQNFLCANSTKLQIHSFIFSVLA